MDTSLIQLCLDLVWDYLIIQFFKIIPFHRFYCHFLAKISGYYAFIEASYPRQKGDKARLISGTIKADSKTGGKCLDFHYHMYGPHVDELAVYQDYGGTKVKKWSRIGNNGNRWRHAVVSLKGTADYKVSPHR